ncbi:MAG: hypothetical protein RR244_01870, partial [Oscillospiraceae bacterium]
ECNSKLQSCPIYMYSPTAVKPKYKSARGECNSKLQSCPIYMYSPTAVKPKYKSAGGAIQMGGMPLVLNK